MTPSGERRRKAGSNAERAWYNQKRAEILSQVWREKRRKLLLANHQSLPAHQQQQRDVSAPMSMRATTIGEKLLDFGTLFASTPHAAHMHAVLRRREHAVTGIPCAVGMR